MYAIIRAGGKQYKVQPGDVVRVEKLDQQLGAEFDLTEVLILGGDKTLLGQPLVQNAKVTVVVTKQARAPKVIVFKKRRRQGYRKTQGHRQYFTELFVKSITSPDGVVTKTEAQPKVVDIVAERANKIIERTKPTRKEKILAAKSGSETEVKKATVAKKTKKVAKAAAPKKAKTALASKAAKATKKVATKKVAKSKD